MTFFLGLTGSIGMGKSTTAKMFLREGCEVWDADAAVHRLYGVGGAAVGPVKKLFPEAIVDDEVERQTLKEIISANPDALKQIEAIVHPLVAQDREVFKQQATADILVFDIPLLFETGGDKSMDAVACVSISPEVQEKRVLNRGTMNKNQFELIRQKQFSDKEKRAKSDFLIITDTLENAREQVRAIVAELRAGMKNA